MLGDLDVASIALGGKIPDFKYITEDGVQHSFCALAGFGVVLYFYPKDNTPGCTLEGQQFRDQHKAFSKLGVKIFGVSRDSIPSHEKFKAKHQFNFALISDQDEKICKLFDVIKLKNMYGKKVLGIERSTFLIDSNGIMRQQWRKVKIEGHVAEVLAEAKLMSKKT